MNNLLRQLARLLPRRLRNVLRAPGRALRWWWQDRQSDVQFSPGHGWSLRCPPRAVEGAFHLQLDDPPQVAEFSEFMEAISAFKNPFFIDIGCHYGLFSFALVDRCGPEAQAIAIDPSGSACAMVRRISAANGWVPRIQVQCAAAGDRVGELEMVDAGVMSAGYFVLPTDQPARDRVRVPVHTIDELVAKTGRIPELIKIDVESFEGEVLSGGENTLMSGNPLLFLEMHNRLMRDRGVDPAGVLALLRRFGYAQFACSGHKVGDAEILAPEIIRIVARKAGV